MSGISCTLATATESVQNLNRIQINSKLNTYIYCLLVSSVYLHYSWDDLVTGTLPYNLVASAQMAKAGFHGLNLDVSYFKSAVRYSAWLLLLLWMGENLLPVLCHTSHSCRHVQYAWVFHMALAASIIEPHSWWLVGQVAFGVPSLVCRD